MLSKERKPKIVKTLGVVLLALVALGVLAVGIFLAINVNFSNPEDLKAFLDTKMKKLDLAGLAFAVVEGDTPVEFHSYGYADLVEERPITEDTLFQMASVSKTVTGTAVMQLSDRGRIDIDEDINTYLPFDVKNPSHPNKAITTRMLLTHTSSIIDNWDVYDSFYTIDAGGGDPTVSLADFNRGYLTKDGEYYDAELNFSAKVPGTYYKYSNCGYGLLGYLVECVSGTDFNIYCTENIFTPLGMDSTRWFLEEIDLDRLAKPHEGEKALPYYGFATYPDGCLRTSAGDYSRFLSMFMHQGTLGNVKILEESTVAEMLKPQVRDLNENQGLTWDLKVPEEIFITCDSYVYGHSGGDPGVSTMVMFNQDIKKAAILLINSDVEMKELITYRQIVKRMVEEISE
ncbi:MAG: beta-lactamase family protein [Spirochaetales bacterium]|nr:beta-lactamase family protein [Spirochaetales bacterium]